MKIIKGLLLLMIAVIFSSCSSAIFTGFNEANKEKSINLASKNCVIEDKALKYQNKENPTLLTSINDPIYNGNHLGYKSFLCGEFQKSLEILQIVEDSYRFSVDEQNIAKKAGKEVAHAITNANATDYEGMFYERVLTNTYKAMDYLALKDYASARVEINRAIDRQRIAKDEFKRLIDKKMQNLENAENTNNLTNQIMQENFNFIERRAYKDFTNPFVSYFAGLFFVLDKDYNKALEQFKEVMEQEDSIYFKQDYALANANFSLRQSKKNKKNKIFSNDEISSNGKYIWLIFDNGLGKNLEEINLTIPFPFTTNGAYDVSTINFAIAKLGESINSYDYLILESTKTQMLSDMDSVITAEYKAHLPYNITKALINTITKAATNIAATKEDKTLGLATNIFTFLTNHADIRYFVGIPKNYQLARIPNKGIIYITSPQNEIILNQNIDTNKHFVVYVKSPIAGVFYSQIFEER